MQNKMNKKQAKRISDDLYRQGGPAEQSLRIRCEQERKVRLEVIMEWGDPRKWKNIGE
jgi:polyhydroxyalkanoate synthesis regulator phasin